MGVEAGMRAMLERRRAELDAGAEPIGWKIGINVDAVQDRLGISEPVVGYLTSATMSESGAEVDVSGWTNPVLEPEVAIRVGEAGEVAALAPAIELVDIDLPFDEIEPILAGNVFHRGVVIGGDVVGAGIDGVRCRVTADGEEIAAAEVSDDPAATIAHVDRVLAAHGARLEPGQRIIAGSLSPPLPVRAGSHVEVDLGALGVVAVGFA